MNGVTRTAAMGALLVAAGVAVAGCANGMPAQSTPSGPSGPSAPSNAAGPAGGANPAQPAQDTSPSARQAKSQLLVKVPGQQAVLVSAPSGYDAITYDQRGHVGFWSDGSSGWTESSVGSYPYSADLGKPGTKATGAVLHGMNHATFIVTGAFSEDGTGNAVAYAPGSSGWGVVVAQPNGNLKPTTPNVDDQNSGVSYGLSLSGGQLQTEDCPPDQPLAACGDHNTIKKLWRWDGTQFVRG